MDKVDKLNELCSQITGERDPAKLRALGREINELLKQNSKVVFEATASKHQIPDKKAA
jgi:hypothetical protein